MLLPGSVSKDNIEDAFSRLKNQAAGSPPARLFLFYLSTHGQPFRDQERFDTVLQSCASEGSHAKNPVNTVQSHVRLRKISIFVQLHLDRPNGLWLSGRAFQRSAPAAC
jgi:hypothetical protein